ncbi:hypothetical protein NP233_g6214 [Leucocoprinus birnbaumii]|uniref:Helitron helicase-like domain-containing protein n=1 Tax=Leucocoprinus birnbaumii TaxID=56174 RepID=A0AAD5VRJ9_9AGAR|nr:hypothetical protein NP233_g6214 [Leucocoprinus birnbaumii]
MCLTIRRAIPAAAVTRSISKPLKPRQFSYQTRSSGKNIQTIHTMCGFPELTMEQIFRYLTMDEIISQLPHPGTIPLRYRRSSASLIEYIAAYPPLYYTQLVDAARLLVYAKRDSKGRFRKNRISTGLDSVCDQLAIIPSLDAGPSRLTDGGDRLAIVDDRSHTDGGSDSPMGPLAEDSHDFQPLDREAIHDPSRVIERQYPPDVVKDVIRTFRRKTGNYALSSSCCAVCARDTPLVLLELFESALLIPNRHLLKPFRAHSEHRLFEGILLHGISSEGGEANVCMECLNRLSSGRLPPLSLANNMWIGTVPFELRILTLAEKILIARYYVAAYIIKLYPKDPSVKYWDSNTLNSGLKGNVSTYPLNAAELAHYLNQSIMPPPISILSETISVTVVGPTGFPERTLPDVLVVRRQRVCDALVWLSRHNPLYRDIEISDERLRELPINGVPDVILQTTRLSTDTAAVAKEHDSYVPQDDDPENSDEDSDSDAPSDTERNSYTHALNDLVMIDEQDQVDQINRRDADTGPAVVPLQSYGVVDVTGTSLPDVELMAHALANTVISDGPDLQIRRGSAFINEYARVDPDTGERIDGGPTNPNHLLGAFPWLFPYGCGGFEVERQVDVSYESHVRWALQYEDKRFRLDHRFIFQVFGVMQKRSICRAASLRMTRPVFQRHSDAISALTVDDFIRASEEELAGRPFSNPTMRALRKEVSTVRVQVHGTDESRIGIRRKIWGATAVFGPPSIWLTLNPSDTQDPIVQVLAGVDIDLDEFDSRMGPNATQRAINVARDPYAAASYFHKVIEIMLGSVFGITAARGAGRVKRSTGLLGKVQCYVGTVEAQGRGTLHLHIVLWLEGAPCASDMVIHLQNPRFRARICQFIRMHITADIDGMNTDELHRMPRQTDYAYSRPLDPDDSNFAGLYDERQRLLARAVQLHKCTQHTCLKTVKGVTKCKRRAPFELSSSEWVNSAGRWGPRRICGYVNNFNSCILQLLRSNHDIKLITNGVETRDICWYITNYAAKKQNRSSNVSALLARRYAFHVEQESRNPDIHRVHLRLIERCANTLSREQEFSAPEIYLDAILDALVTTYPDIRIRGDAPSDPTPQRIVMDRISGSIRISDQLSDYLARGDELNDYSFMQFMLDTYDSHYNPLTHSASEGRRGRRPNTRVPYIGTGRERRCRIIRSNGHETLPDFVGKWPPRNDNEELKELYCAFMLLLFRPWRQWPDILGGNSTFRQVFDGFMTSSPVHIRKTLDNIQYYYSSMDCAERARSVNDGNGPLLRVTEDEISERRHFDDGYISRSQTPDITEEAIAAARDDAIDPSQRRFGEIALEIANDAGFFSKSSSTYENGVRVAPVDDRVRRARDGELDTFATWTAQLEQTTRGGGRVVDIQALPNVPMGVVTVHSTSMSSDRDATVRAVDPAPTETIVRRRSTRHELDILNEEQRRAHDIVETHLLSTLNGHKPAPLLMTCFGEGGTGKTTVINAITKTFREHGSESLLAKNSNIGSGC